MTYSDDLIKVITNLDDILEELHTLEINTEQVRSNLQRASFHLQVLIAKIEAQEGLEIPVGEV